MIDIKRLICRSNRVLNVIYELRFASCKSLSLSTCGSNTHQNLTLLHYASVYMIKSYCSLEKS